MIVRSPLLLPLAVGSLTLAAACGAGTDDETGTGGSGSTSSNTSTTSSGFGGASSTTTGQGGGCAATTAQAELIPLDIIIVLDESGSMSGTKWTTVTGALKDFVTDPLSTGISVGLLYFPNFQTDDCVVTDYTSLDVDIGELPSNSTLLVNSINSHAPHGSTPTYGALKGALIKATAYQDLNPTHKVIVVLASDGDPGGCYSSANPDWDDIPTIAAQAAGAYSYNGVQTYTIAMDGATVASLDEIAAAGGTVEAYDVTASVTAFSEKMAEIRSNALGCNIAIPPPPDGQSFEPTLVNVKYTPMGSGTPTDIPKADNLADCGNGSGWYYDNDAAPTKIILCPATCDTVQADAEAKVDVAFGCTTIPN